MFCFSDKFFDKTINKIHLKKIYQVALFRGGFVISRVGGSIFANVNMTVATPLPLYIFPEYPICWPSSKTLVHEKEREIHRGKRTEIRRKIRENQPERARESPLIASGKIKSRHSSNVSSLA